MGVFDSDDEVVKRTIGDARAARLRARGATVTRSLVTGSPRVLARTLDRGTKRLLDLRGGLAAPGGGGEEEGGGGAPVPILNLDFATGTYTVDGVSVAAAAVVSDASKIAGGGLTLAAEVDFPVEIIGDAGTIARGSWGTVVITYDTNVAATRWEGNGLFSLTDDEVLFLELLAVLTYSTATDQDETNSRFIQTISGSPSDGTHKTGIRRTADDFSGSTDGQAIVSDTGTPGAYTPTAAFIGGPFSDQEVDGCKVLKIEFYEDALSDAELLAALA